MYQDTNEFTQYFKSVIGCSRLNTTDTDIDDIRKLSKDLIGKIWVKALNKNDYFELSKVIPVGSIEEGSRLFTSDELDFMMIVQMKDFPIDEIMIQKGCRPGFVQLFLKEQPVRLNKCFINIQLHSWKFRKHLLSQLQKIDDLSEKSGILKQTKRKLDETDMIGNVQHDLLQILGEHEIEAWNVAFDWGEMWISVDTMPAIEIPKGQMEEFERSQRDLLFHDQTHKRGAFKLEQNYYLVPKGCQKDDNEEGCGCWLIDFAPTEVAILRAMDKTHRDCHKFLKYILKHGHDLPSYLVKSAVLKHLGKCTGSSSEEICMLEILNYILKCVDDAFLPDPFLRNLNAFGWKEFDHLRPLSSIKTAIIFEHNSRYVDLLLQTILKMTQENTTIQNPLNGCRDSMVIEYILPISQKLQLLDDFIKKKQNLQ